MYTLVINYSYTESNYININKYSVKYSNLYLFTLLMANEMAYDDMVNNII